MIVILGAVPRTHAVFGEGIGPIILHTVRCSGFEHRLIDCAHALSSSNCNHERDAGVTCARGNSESIYVHICYTVYIAPIMPSTCMYTYLHLIRLHTAL